MTDSKTMYQASTAPTPSAISPTTTFAARRRTPSTASRPDFTRSQLQPKQRCGREDQRDSRRQDQDEIQGLALRQPRVD